MIGCEHFGSMPNQQSVGMLSLAFPLGISENYKETELIRSLPRFQAMHNSLLEMSINSISSKRSDTRPLHG